MSLSADAPAPRFALANEGGDERRVRDASWVVYRRTDGWERVAAGRSGGTPVTLAPDGETAWMLLVRDADDEYTVQTAAVASSTTRFVGPVSLSSGVHAFVVEGRVDGEQFDVAARFAVA